VKRGNLPIPATLTQPGPISAPPYRIETQRCVIRAWEPRDARLLDEAIFSSLEHLQRWLPWAVSEPRSLAQRIEYLRGARARFDRDEEYTFGILALDESRVLGGTGLHKRGGAEALEIGYWIRSEVLRQGYCSEVVTALTRVALTTCHAQRVEIHCDPANCASQAIPKKLGYQLDAVLRKRARTPTGMPRDTMVWSLFAEELAQTASSAFRYSSFDASGEPIIDALT